MLVLAVSMLMTAIREKTIKSAETIELVRTVGTGKNVKKSEGDEYPGNFT